MGIADKIAEIEKEMSRTQKNKATEGVLSLASHSLLLTALISQHLGLLKAKLAKLRSQLIEAATGDKKGPGEGFDVMKSGDARVPPTRHQLDPTTALLTATVPVSGGADRIPLRG